MNQQFQLRLVSNLILLQRNRGFLPKSQGIVIQAWQALHEHVAHLDCQLARMKRLPASYYLTLYTLLFVIELDLLFIDNTTQQKQTSFH